MAAFDGLVHIATGHAPSLGTDFLVGAVTGNALVSADQSPDAEPQNELGSPQ